MAFVRTTPPRSVDVPAVFPELAPLARDAIRLHPRPGAPSVRDSSVGGPLLWPADEPWPYCEAAHVDSGHRVPLAELRLTRLRVARQHRAPEGPAFTPEEEAARERNAAIQKELSAAGPPWPAERPVPMLPVAQLYLRDVPLLRPPGGADLLQVLWCPYDHRPDHKPATALFWRSAADVGAVLGTPPEPYEANCPGYLPEPCLLSPEAITDYPHSLDTDPEIQEALEDWDRWLAADTGLSPEIRSGLEDWQRLQAADDDEYAWYPTQFYDDCLADVPGWKAGGWPPWGRTDPAPQQCAVCEARMVPLLTIASFEWDGYEGRSWAPNEDQAAAYAPPRRAPRDLSQPTKVEVGSTDNLQLYVCPASPDHPHTDLIQ